MEEGEEEEAAEEEEDGCGCCCGWDGRCCCGGVCSLAGLDADADGEPVALCGLAPLDDGAEDKLADWSEEAAAAAGAAAAEWEAAAADEGRDEDAAGGAPSSWNSCIGGALPSSSAVESRGLADGLPRPRSAPPMPPLRLGVRLPSKPSKPSLSLSLISAAASPPAIGD